MLGHAKDSWDGSTLIVTTTNMAVDRFDNAGTPFSEDMRLIERYWIWRPEIVVSAYDCNRDQSL